MKIKQINQGRENYLSSQENLQSLQTFNGLVGFLIPKVKSWSEASADLVQKLGFRVFIFLLSQAKHFLLKNNISVVKYTTK